MVVERRPLAAIVVDPYSSGRFLLYDLKARNVPIICVRSSLNLGAFFLKVYDTHRAYFAETVDYEKCGSDLQQLVICLNNLPYTISAVFAGCEPGVVLAEQLSEALALSTSNGTALLRARKDKAEMQERLRQCGVPAAEQIRSSDLSELLSWARNRNRWPVVAKPTGSSGSDGIFFCHSEADVAAAHSSVVGKVNPNGVLNAELVVQEFLSGDEYIVDTVSHNGHHLCVAVWIYRKRRGTQWNPHAILSEGNQLLPASGEAQDSLVSYVFQVLDAVGLRFGPCHTEVMLTERGPVLVEVNARLHGLQGPRLIELATGISKATLAVDALLAEGELFNKLYVPAPGRWLYPVLQQCKQLVLISHTSGYLRRSIKDALDEMSLPSVIEVLPAVQKGGLLQQSNDLNSIPGTVLMVHASPEQIEADTRRIREAEESGALYLVSAEPLPDSPPASPRPSAQPSSPRLRSSEKAEEFCFALPAACGEVTMSGLDDA